MNAGTALSKSTSSSSPSETINKSCLVKGPVEAETHLNVMQNVCGCEILPQQCLQPVSDDATTASVEAGSCSLPVEFLFDKYSTRLPTGVWAQQCGSENGGDIRSFRQRPLPNLFCDMSSKNNLKFCIVQFAAIFVSGELCLHNTIHQSLCCTSTSAHAFTFSQLVKGDVVCQHLEHFIKTYFTL